MSINTEDGCKDTILGVLLHYNGRTGYLLLHEEIKAKIPLAYHHRIHELLESIKDDGYIDFHLLVSKPPEYSINTKGREFYDNGNGGYCKQKDKPVITGNTFNLDTGGGAVSIQGSQIGTHASLLLDKSLEITTDKIETNNINSPLPTVKSIGWRKKFSIWLINNIWQVILGFIAGLMVYFYTKEK